MPTETKPYNKEAAAAEIRARNDAMAAERNKMSDEEYQRILDANYRGAD